MGDFYSDLFAPLRFAFSQQPTKLLVAEAPPPVRSSAPPDGYMCMKVEDKPWIAGYDLQHDGYIDAKDFKAFFYRSKLLEDTERPSLDVDCSLFKIGMLEGEVQWKLQALTTRLVEGGISRGAALKEIEALNNDVMAPLDRLSGGLEEYFIVQHSRCRITEMVLRASNLVNGTASELFGIGIALLPSENESGLPLIVQTINEQSPALELDIRVNDRIVAVDGVRLEDLSSDGTIEGMLDELTGLARGFGGPLGSKVKLTIERQEGFFSTRTFDVEVPRLVWSANTKGCPKHTAPFFDGKQRFKP